jgi:putative restriction endonuclease
VPPHTYDESLDRRLRAAAFLFMRNLVAEHGEYLPWAPLARGFEFDGETIPITTRSGIFTPRQLAGLPLSIRTSPRSDDDTDVYPDDWDDEGFLSYSYLLKDKQNPTDWDRRHAHNEGLRRAMRLQSPLVYLYGVEEGVYLAEWPVFVVGDDPARGKFKIKVSDRYMLNTAPSPDIEEVADKRYATVHVLQRVHQRSFAKKVIDAYKERCAICRLRRRAFLDAAHILPDRDPRSEPRVSHGLALCKLHHVAFDGNFLGIRPDMIVEIRKDLLDEPDGPMLEQGLKGFHNKRIDVPRQVILQPNQEFLAERYEQFREAV